MIDLLLTSFTISVVQRVVLLLLFGLFARFLGISVFCCLLPFFLSLRTSIVDSRGLRAILRARLLHAGMWQIRLNFLHFSFHAIVDLLDNNFFFFVLPIKGVGLVFVMQIIDTSVCPNIISDLLSFTIVDSLHLSQMLHVHLVSHLIVDYISCSSRVYH